MILRKLYLKTIKKNLCFLIQIHEHTLLTNINLQKKSKKFNIMSHKF